MCQIIFIEEHEYFYPKMIGDIGIRGPRDLRWIRPNTKYNIFEQQHLD